VQRYILFRIGQSVLTLLVLTVIVFSLARLSGDPLDVLLPLEATNEDAERLRAAWGLDKPVHIQYFTFLGNALTGDFGDSLRVRGRTAMSLVLERLPNTAALAGVAIIVAIVIAVPIGVLSAVKKDTPFDYVGKVIALFGQSLPAFWLGLMLMWVFAAQLGWFPVSGKDQGALSYILPAVAIGWFQVAALMRLVRSSMLDVLDTEYVKLARIKGVVEWKVIWKHCLRNAAIAPFTYFALIIGSLMVGSVSIEFVFAWPGVGRLMLEGVAQRNFPIVEATVLTSGFFYILTSLFVDILYVYVDPRIRIE
jgi:peptide/nickel transport system permease protein